MQSTLRRLEKMNFKLIQACVHGRKTTFPGSLKTNLSAFKSEDIKLHVSFLLFLQLYKHSMSVKTQ